MQTSRTALSLRTLLLFDAATCAVMGAILALGAAPLAALMRIPAPLLLYAGLALLPIAAFMALVGTRPAIPPAGAWLVIAGNAAWVAGSVLLLAAGWIAPNALGTGFVAAQALVVAVLAKLEHGALRDTAVAARAG